MYQALITIVLQVYMDSQGVPTTGAPGAGAPPVTW